MVRVILALLLEITHEWPLDRNRKETHKSMMMGMFDPALKVRKSRQNERTMLKVVGTDGKRKDYGLHPHV